MKKSEVQKLYVIPEEDPPCTFRFDPHLPSLPLPDLRHTLDRYLDSVKPFLKNAEMEKTQRLVNRFYETDGALLHSKLKLKAAREQNWVERWWEEHAYLRVRSPLLPFCSMDGVLPTSPAHKWTFSSFEDRIQHGALYLYLTSTFWTLLREERLRPTQSADKKTNFSMSQFRRLYNTVRIPGKEVDTLISYFKTVAEGTCPSHVIFLCQGRIFRADMHDSEGNLLLPADWEIVLKDIISKCERLRDGDGVGIFTVDDRTSWSKNRERLLYLSARNAENLREIETAIAAVVLDQNSPKNDSEASQLSLCGDLRDRWADKSTSFNIYSNGRIGGSCDHTAFDGLVSITVLHYCYLQLEEWEGKTPKHLLGNLKNGFQLPKELEFDLDDTLRSEMRRIYLDVEQNKKKIVVARESFTSFGKTEIQNWKLHPDYTMQMALQLAYMRLHGDPAPCYETATTRGYYNGRTETVRSCTIECINWVKAMMDPTAQNDERRELLKIAVAKHDKLMTEARNNAGCDRHLFGLFCTALEEGLPIPDLFNDPAYKKSGGHGNFILSTSLTGYTPVSGGVAPMCIDGYGLFYCFSTDCINFCITVDTRSDKTDAKKIFAEISKSLHDIRKLMQPSISSKL